MVKRMRVALAAVALLGISGWGAAAHAEESPAGGAEGTLVVKTRPAGGEVIIDGASAGKAPVTRNLPTGSHKVEVTWPEGGKLSARVRIAAGVTKTLRLAPKAEAAAAEPSPEAPTTTTTAAAEAAAPSGEVPPTGDAAAIGSAEPAMPAQGAGEPDPSTAAPVEPGDAAAEPVAAAEAPAPMQESVIAEPILSARHPHRRFVRGFSVGLGVLCPNFSTPSIAYGSWCTPRVHVARDFIIGNWHLALLAGPTIQIAAQFGLELGSPYFRLGKKERAAIAIRGSFDGLIGGLRVDVPGRRDDGLLSFVNTYGPTFSFRAGKTTTVDLRAAVGWAVGGFFDGGGMSSGIYALVADGWVAVRFMP